MGNESFATPAEQVATALSRREAAILTERAAAYFLGLSVRTLQKRRFERQTPPYLKIGRSVRYRLDDLEAFIQGHRIDPAHDGRAA